MNMVLRFPLLRDTFWSLMVMSLFIWLSSKDFIWGLGETLPGTYPVPSLSIVDLKTAAPLGWELKREWNREGGPSTCLWVT